MLQCDNFTLKLRTEAEKIKDIKVILYEDTMRKKQILARFIILGNHVDKITEKCMVTPSFLFGF